MLRADTPSALRSHRGIKAGSASAVVENVHDAAGVQVHRTTEAILDHRGRVDSQRVVDRGAHVIGVVGRGDRLTTDVAYMAFWAAYMRDGVTPLDDWQGIGMALAGSLLSAWVVGRLIGDLVERMLRPPN